MALRSDGFSTPVSIGLVGGGKGGSALLDLLLDWPGAKVSVVIDPRADAPALRKAQTLGIPTAPHHLDVFAHPVNLVLEVTGNPDVLNDLLRAKPPGVEVIGAGSLRFFWELLEDKVKTARQLEAQLDIAKALGSTLNLKQQLAIATQRLAQVSGADRCGLYFWNEAAGLVTPVMSQFATGEPNKQMWAAFKGLGRLKLREVPFLYEVMERRGPIEIADPASNPLVPPGWADLFEIKSMLVVPIFRKNRVVGACTLNYCREPRHFTSEQANVAIAVAGQVALTLENARLFEETQERLRHTETLLAVSEGVDSTLELSEVVRRTTREIVRALGADMGGAWRLGPSGDQIIPVAGYHIPKDLVETLFRTPLPLEHPLMEEAKWLEGPIYSSDSQADPRFDHPLIRLLPHKSLLVQPMWAKGKRVGGFTIIWVREPHNFTPEEMRLVEGIARQAAIAIENARLFEEIKRQARVAEEQAHTARMLTESLDVSAVGAHIVEQVLTVFQVQAAVVWLLHPDGSMEILASGGPNRFVLQPGTVFPLEMGIPGKTVLQGKPLQFADVLSEPTVLLPDDVRRGLAESGTAAILGVPLRARGKSIGALVIRDRTGRVFSGEEVAVLETFAGQAALALDNARLYQEAQRRTEKLEALARLTRLMTQATEPQEALDFITRSVVGLLNATNAYLLLKEPEEPHDLVVRSSFGPKADLPHPKVPMGQGVIGGIAASRRPEFIPDVLEDPRWLYPEFVRTLGRSFFGIPLVLGDEIVGCLAVFTDQPGPLGPEELDLLKIFADQAAIVLENARLFDEVRRSYDDFRQAQERLVRVERLRALGEMAAGVAHDFNNLLAVILGRAELLMARVKDPDLVRGLTAMRDAALDGAQTVRRIQEFTRTRRTRPFGRVDLVELLREVVELTRPRWKDEAQSRGVSYEVRVEGGPAPPVAGISEELREVFTNLLINALEAMPAGGRVSFYVSADADEVMVTAEDSGCGMSEETHRRVFEPFFTTKGPRGTGLGLAVAWGIITRHGGTIEVKSTIGTGSTFTVRLPIGQEFPSEKKLESVPQPPRGARVLVIDDEPQVRRVLRDLLTTAGYTVLEAADGAEGLARCEAESVDLVLSDLSMPKMSGWEVAAASRARFPWLPVGFITGWGDQLDQDQLDRHGIRFVLAKPFAMSDVLRQVAQILRETKVD